jgi:hypothetical protein
MRAGSKAQGAWGQCLLAMVLMACAAFAQTASDLGEGLRAELTGTPGVTAIKWWGKAGRTYFVQSSETLLPDSWQYMPVVESGADAVCTWNLQTSASKMFVRLIYTDQFYTADFDGDGISNAAEVAAGGPGTDPFLADTDWDGHGDAAELLAGTSPTSGSSNPGGGGGGGPLNPDASYRRGLRLEYSRMHMSATSTAYPDEGVQKYHSSGSGVHLRPNATTYFYPYKSDNTKDITEEVVSAYQSEAFMAPERAMFHPWPSVGLARIKKYYRFQPAHSPLFNEQKEYTREKIKLTVVASPDAPADARRSFFAFVTQGGYEPVYFKAEGLVDVSALNIQLSAGLKGVLEEPGPDKVLELAVDANTPDLAPADDTKRTDEWLYVWFADVDMEPAANMAGVVGDVVPSVKPGSKVRHFVTPKLTTELPQPEVECRVAGWTNASTFNEYFEWDCTGGQQGADSLSWKVSRATADVTKLKIRSKRTKAVLSEMHVWVVWCDPPTVTAGAAQFVQLDEPILDPVTGQPTGLTRNVESGYRSSATRRFKYTIKPAEICDLGETERPNLEGAKRFDPPGFPNPYILYSGQQADTAANKWDVSRKMKVTIRNPYGIVRSKLEEKYPAALCVNQPTTEGQNPPDDVPVNYPTDPVEGNDDPILPDGPDEDTNPYVASSSGDLSHGNGELTSVDAPNLNVRRSWGTLEEHLALELNFKEFCRLEITDGARSAGTRWFRISDYHDWHFYLHTDFDDANDQWENGSPPSATGSGHPLP